MVSFCSFNVGTETGQRQVPSLPDVVEESLRSWQSGRNDSNSEPDVIS